MKYPLSRGWCGIWQRCLKTVPHLETNQIYFQEFFTVSKNFLISLVLR